MHRVFVSRFPLRPLLKTKCHYFPREMENKVTNVDYPPPQIHSVDAMLLNPTFVQAF